MVDGWRVEPTGQGVVIMWRRSSLTGEWKDVRYSVKTLPDYFAAWERNPSDIGVDRDGGWLLGEMRAAYELEMEVVTDLGRCLHTWEEMPGEPPEDACTSCGIRRR